MESTPSLTPRPLMPKLNGRAHGDLMVFGALIFLKLLLFNRQLGMIFPQGLISAVLGSVLVFLGLFSFLPPKNRSFWLYVFDWIISGVIVADLIYFRYFGDVISIPVLRQVSQTGAVWESIFSLIHFTDLLYLLDLFLLIPGWKLLKQSQEIFINNSLKIRLALAFLLLVVGSSLVAFKFLALEQKMGKNFFTNILDQTFFVEHVGILNFHLFDFYNFSKKELMALPPKEGQWEEVQNWFQGKQNYAAQKPQYFGLAQGLNLIMVQVEALQGFVVNQQIEGQEITPNLNQLLKESLYFPNFYYQTAHGNTSDAEFTTQVSFYPAKQGAAYFQYAHNHFHSLAHILKEQGYSTLAMHAYKPSYWNRANMYRTLGFERFYSRMDFTHDELLGWGLGDNSFLRQGAQILKKENGPFYAFMVTLSSHHPYQAFSDYPHLKVGKYEGTFFGNYLKAVHYADEALGSFIQELKKSGLWDNSLVVIYGDHSGIDSSNQEALLEFLDLPNDALTWACLQKVPLFIHLPKEKLTGTVDTPGGQVDLLPTLLNLLGLNSPKVMGQDLLNAKSNTVIFRNGSFTNGEIFYLSPSQTLYDLTTGRKLPLEPYLQEIQRAQKALWVSDMVLENNWLKNFTH